MILRSTLIALMVLSAGAWAGEGDGADAPGTPRAPGAPAHLARPAPPPVAPVAEDEDGTVGPESTDTTLAVPARGRLELDGFSGAIHVSGWDRDAMRIQAEHRPGTSVSWEVGPATVVLRSIRLLRIPEMTPRRRVRVQRIPFPTDVDYRLTVPRGMSLRLSGVNTDISVLGVEGDVSAEAVTGAVVVRGGRGSIRASSVNGDVEVSGARGSVEAGSMSARVTLRDVQGRVRVESVSGDVNLERIASDAVEATTVSGQLNFSGVLRPGGTYHLESHSGDVTVSLTERPDVAVSVNTYSGEFASSFPVQSTSSSTSVRGRGKEFDFTLGDGRAELSLESFSGLIRLVRAGQPAGSAPVILIRRHR